MAHPHPDPSSYAKKFSGKYAHRLIKGGVGHNLPQEAPQAFAQAVIDVDGYCSRQGYCSTTDGRAPRHESWLRSARYATFQVERASCRHP